MKTQELILRRITDIGEAQGYVVTNDSDYANTGWLTFLDKKTLNAVASMSYQFDVKNYRVEIFNGKPPVHAGKRNPLYMNKRSDENSDVLQGVANAITRD